MSEQTQHKDKLNKQGTCEVYLAHGYRDYSKVFVGLDRARTTESSQGSFFLIPSEALSLLVWLEQNRTELEQLAQQE